MADTSIRDLERAAEAGDRAARSRLYRERERQGLPSGRPIVAFDLETYRIGPGAIAPKPVCCSYAQRIANLTGYDARSAVSSNGDAEWPRLIDGIFTDEDLIIVGANIRFDLGVIVAHFPHLTSHVWHALAEGRVHDVQLREKLLNLSTHGRLEYAPLPDGTAQKVSYSLATLERQYLGRDRSADKTDSDAWRANYSVLDGVPSNRYPRDAYEYSREDAIGTLLVYEAQEERVKRGDGLLTTHEFQTAASFALHLATCWGFAVDLDEKARIQEMLARELAPEKTALLVAEGILRPAVPPRPYANGAKNEDGSPKMTAGEAESVNRKRLQEVVAAVSTAHGVELKETPSGGISTDKEVLETLAHLSPVIAEYQHRQALQKLVTTELPRLSAPVVHPNYDPLKETGRTSSYAGEPYPSCNIQQIDPRARACYVARPGMVLCSVDYSSIEFVSLAQKCYSLFGHSVLRDLINEGIDPHAYLGGILASHLDTGFRDFAGGEEPREILAIFKACEHHESKDIQAFFKKYRKLAKPVGFGFPGGLGPDKFISFARASYGVTVSLEEAITLREIFFETYPEIPQYFGWINEQAEGDSYFYYSPFGMLRRGASYCAAANGAGLQTPVAEGAKLAVFEVSRACHDPAMNSCLLGCHIVAFIHDELILEIPEDRWMHERATEIARLMREAMEVIMRDVAVRTKAVLMRRWNKDAEAVYVDGRLQVYEGAGI